MKIIAMGLDLPIGSMEEAFVLRSIWEQGQAEYLKTLTIVNSVVMAANGIISALSDGEATPNNDKLKNVLNYLKDLLIPQLREDTEKKAADAKAVLEEEESKVYTVRKLSNSTAAQKGRVRLRRRNG